MFEIELFIYMDFALKNLQWLIRHKTKQNQTRPYYHPSLLAGRPDNIVFPRRAVAGTFLLVSQYWHVRTKRSIVERHLSVRSRFSSSVPQI